MADETSQAPPQDDVLDELTFTTSLVGIPFRFDGVKYEIRHPDNCSVERMFITQRLISQIGPLFILGDRAWTPDQKQDVERLTIDALADIDATGKPGGAIVNAPREVVAKMVLTQRAKILDVFTVLRTHGSDASEAKPTAPTVDPSHGTKASPDSAGSTAGTRRPGGRPSR